ncbi:MAG: nucleotidyltransferase [Actinobacteria bacterium]|nr:nucleotidyltransferase [Actinomycetota bacterium]
MMATTITSSFSALKANLEITGLQTQTVSTRHQSVRAAITKDFTILEDFLTGSYKRNTMIAPLSEADIDVFVVLDASCWASDGQAKLLDSVKATLKKSFTQTMSISRNGQAVTIGFSDFQVDVVPGFCRKGGGYLIPDTIGKRWIGTDPKRHTEISSAANASHSGDLVPLIKMIKQWNKTISYPFRSFHLEVLAWDIFTNVSISDYPSGVRYYFDKGKERIAKKNPDPAGYNDDVGSYIAGGSIASAVSNFETAYGRAIKAEQYAKEGKISTAFDEWRKVFGTTKFPAYG